MNGETMDPCERRGDGCDLLHPHSAQNTHTDPIQLRKREMVIYFSVRSALLSVTLTLGLLGNGCFGRQHFRSHIPNSGIVGCPPGDTTCNEGDLCEALGHLSCSGGGERNQFGKDFEAAGKRWTAELCLKDSDGDGFSNGYELGDPCCLWYQGAHVPQWMRDWAVTHPGSAESKPIPGEVDIVDFCKDKDPLESESFFSEGETQIPVEYFVKEHVLPNNHTVYRKFRFNFPDDVTYDIVGMEAVIDSEELVHHYVVCACRNRSEQEGVVLEDFGMTADCEEAFYIWTPGNYNFTLPKHTGLRVGKGTHRVGFSLEIHYDNPLLKPNQSDASGLRFQFTSTPREHQVGVLWTGPINSPGLIPPKQKFFSTTIFQVEVNEDVALGGANVFGFTPHMHALGRRVWTEKLRITDRNCVGLQTDLLKLEKFGDVARDDSWDFNVQYQGRIPETKIRDGEYLSTTCLYDSSERTEFTSGGPGTRDEMCINFLYYYPAEAVESAAFYSGPRFTGLLSNAHFTTMNSVTEILPLDRKHRWLPFWRQAYLLGHLVCDESMPGNDLTLADLFNAPTEERLVAFIENYAEACDERGPYLLLSGIETGGVKCSSECVAFVYNSMGCSLVKDGNLRPLAPSPLEAMFDSHCSEEFMEYYEENKIDISLHSNSRSTATLALSVQITVFAFTIIFLNLVH